MNIPFSRKVSMHVRGLVVMEVPWLFGKITVNKDNLVLKYFLSNKVINFKDISKVKVFDNILQITVNKTTYQIRTTEAYNIEQHILA